MHHKFTGKKKIQLSYTAHSHSGDFSWALFVFVVKFKAKALFPGFLPNHALAHT